MSGTGEDPRVAAARYRLERLEADGPGGADADRETDAGTAEASRGPGPIDPSRQPTATDRAAYVETAIQQAIRRGDFDDLPGAGKPIPHLGDHHDPDWWIRRKIETEQLTGLGPPALTLRTENLELADRLDALTREEDVREALDDFNARVRLARMQLLGGPPVVTPLRDVDAEVRAWRERRAARARAAADAAPPDTSRPRRRGERRRR